MAEKLLTVEQAAERAECGRTRMFQRVASGEIESVKIGRLRRIPESALDRWISKLLNEQKAGGAAA
jgi:excisionase family DNA binding protein